MRRRGEVSKQQLLGLIEHAVAAGELSPTLDRALAYRVIRSVLIGELERWLITRPHPSLTQSLHELRAALALLVGGLQRRP